ncbi:hypothetical protein KFK09_007801 [Dendrobium nobile]|uniref:Uncharacterized protein n=1 Tax=Dendrobium nobile TaxID=94219 RepID=A0A8T3BVB9_DENNO|nr:hypothetical protein KFK09_007801 [Dendrobium nobile]
MQTRKRKHQKTTIVLNVEKPKIGKKYRAISHQEIHYENGRNYTYIFSLALPHCLTSPHSSLSTHNREKGALKLHQGMQPFKLSMKNEKENCPNQIAVSGFVALQCSTLYRSPA